jgi:hypothetical protein
MEAALLCCGVLRAAADNVIGLKGVPDDLGKRFKRAKSEESGAASGRLRLPPL